ncbi:MAG: T9SS type A sorting domain-containing protein, partial [Balneolaceae bacterium]|nr:T9SS type A sorting domain-containing protein [Balneolaceae bacterium]
IKLMFEKNRIYHLRSTQESEVVMEVELYAADDLSTNLLEDGSSFNTRYGDDNFKINFIPENTGDYFLRLTPPETVVEHEYAVYMKSNSIDDIKDNWEPNNTIAEAAALGDHPGDGKFYDYMLFDESVEGFHDDLDYYQVTAAAGDTITAETAPLDGELWPRDFDAYMYLYDAEGNELASNDDGGTDWHSKITHIADESGQYYFLVIGQDAHVAPRNGDSNRIRDPARGEYKLAITVSGLVVSNEEIGLVHEFDLKQNYPNPFNPTTTIQYSISSVADVRLEVYNVIGQRVATLVNQKQNPGKYNVSFDASSLASGLYFYQLESGGQIQTKKMMLIK